MSSRRALLVAVLVTLLAGACAPATVSQTPTAEPPAPTAAPRPPAVPAPAVAAEPLPDVFESDDFVVVVARGGETAESLAARHLGDAGKAWMIEDFMGARTFTAGQHVAVPKRPWNLTGVEAGGYQIVPVLCYHNLGVESKGRLLLAARQFEEQMRYLKAEGYRVVSLADLVQWLHLRQQLPRKAVVLTFDDGYKAFREHAYPVLKELGFSATLFVYTDYVGAGRNALSWDDLKTLAAEGFDIQAHSKTHGDLRRAAAETDVQYARRIDAELGEPLRLFQRHLGRRSPVLAYPYGRVDDALLPKVREHGYVAAFTVRRESNGAFVPLLQVHRSQIYSEMTLAEFAKNLNVFHDEDLR
jgi:peptidoglycan/xylan/chitin deacetylase (PgdA/CDA1 family)